MSETFRSGESIIAFGDIHLQWQSAQVILQHARLEGINNALTLGDEGAKFYPLESGEEIDYFRLYNELRLFRDENPRRVLISVLGDKTVWVPKDLFKHYVDIAPSGKITGPSIYHHGNIIGAHHGQSLTDENKRLITDYDGYEPLVIFHGSSHSMGVLPKYKWLKDDEFVYWLKKGVEKYQLKPKKVYWVNPGGNFIRKDNNKFVANFAVYNPQNQEIILKSIPYDANTIASSLGV